MPAAPFAARALFEYVAEQDDDLPFAPGQRLTVDEVLDSDWYHGYYVESATGKRLEGIFPINYVEIEKPPSRPSRPAAHSRPSAAPTEPTQSTQAQTQAQTQVSAPVHEASNTASVRAPTLASTSTSSVSNASPAEQTSTAAHTSIPAPPRAFAPPQEDDEWDDDEAEDEEEEKKIVLGAPKVAPLPEEAAKIAAGDAPKESSPKELTKESPGFKEDTTQTSKVPLKDSIGDSVKEPAREPVREPAREPITKASREPAREPAKEPGHSGETPLERLRREEQDAASEKSHISSPAEESESEPMDSIAYEVHALNHQSSSQSALERPVSVVSGDETKKLRERSIESNAFDKLDSAPKIARPRHEGPLDVEEPSESESVDPTETANASLPRSDPTAHALGEITTDKEPDFKTRLARFNQGISKDPEPELKRPERHATFGRTFQFNTSEDSEESTTKHRENTEEYKPSISLKDRIAMLQKSQQQEQEAAQADAAAEERRKERKAQLAAEAEARKTRMQQEAAEREKEAKEQAERRARKAEAERLRAEEEARNAPPPQIPEVPKTEPLENLTQSLSLQDSESSGSAPASKSTSEPYSEPYSESTPSQSQEQPRSHLEPHPESSMVPSTAPVADSHSQAQAQPKIPEAHPATGEGHSNGGHNESSSSASNDDPSSSRGYARGQHDEHDHEEDDDEEDDDAEARRIALRDRMARLANSSGGMNLGMIMGGGIGGAGGGMPKRERRISRSVYDAMSPAEIEAAEARREAEEAAAPVSIFGNMGPMPKVLQKKQEPESDDVSDYGNDEQDQTKITSHEEHVDKHELHEDDHASIKSSPHDSNREHARKSSYEASQPSMLSSPLQESTIKRVPDSPRVESDLVQSPKSDDFHDAVDTTPKQSQSTKTVDRETELGRIPSVLRPQASQAPPQAPPQAPQVPSVRPHADEDDFEFDDAPQSHEVPKKAYPSAPPVPSHPSATSDATVTPTTTSSAPAVPREPPAGPGVSASQPEVSKSASQERPVGSTPPVPSTPSAPARPLPPPAAPKTETKYHEAHASPPSPKITSPPHGFAPPPPPPVVPAVPPPPPNVGGEKTTSAPHGNPPRPPPPPPHVPDAPHVPTRTTSFTPGSPTGPPPPAPGARPAPPPPPTGVPTYQPHAPPPPPPPPAAAPAQPAPVPAVPAHAPAPPPPTHRAPPPAPTTAAPQPSSLGSPPPPPPAPTSQPPPPRAPTHVPSFGSPPPPPPVARPVDDYVSPPHGHPPPSHPPPQHRSSMSRDRDLERTISRDSSRTVGSVSSAKVPTHTVTSSSLFSWKDSHEGIPDGLVSQGDAYKVTTSANTERKVLVVKPDWAYTVTVLSLSSGEQLAKESHSAPTADPSKLKQVSARLGPVIVSNAQRDIQHSEPTSTWVARTIDSAGALVPNHVFGAEIYTNIGNSSVQQLDEIRTGDVCILQDAEFQGSKSPLQKYHKAFKNSVYIVSEWDGTKRKLHFLDSKKESVRLNDLRMGVVRVYRPLDAKYFVG